MKENIYLHNPNNLELLKEQQTKVWYLNHSGFAVKTKHHFLIFDYYPEGEEGLIDVETIAEENVVVFVSHSHHDHYDPCIFDWAKKVEKIHYVLSDDIKGTVPLLDGLKTAVHADEKYMVDDISIETLDSTDEGVAFLIQTDGLTIYHAGDLNWWHWNGESDEYNREMELKYCKTIDKLKDTPIDLAFVVVDGRLEDKYSWGINYFCKNTEQKHIFPMHLFGKYGIIQKLLLDECSKSYREKIYVYSKKGEEFLV